MNDLTKFLDKFARRVKTNPPGACPVSAHLAFLQAAECQTCGKCVPCRDGLGQARKMLGAILGGTAGPGTLESLTALLATIRDAADCAIGYDAAAAVLAGIDECRAEYESHVRDHKCLPGVGQTVPCITKCPAHVDIPGYVALIGAKKYGEAIRLIRRDNPFPTACAYICEHPCEDLCRRNLLDSAINIRGLKRFAVDQANADKVATPAPNVTTGKKIAIVGGGPSGLTAAYFLALMGHKVVVFEERGALGGMLRFGIPNYRLPKDRLDEDIKAILAAGDIEVKLNTAIGRDVTMDSLKKDFQAIYMAIGAQTGKSLPVPGVDAKGVFSAVDMLGEIGRGQAPNYAGKRVVVVGGGNVAMDCARSAVRCGAKEVTLVYRRRQDDMTALPAEVQGALEEGVELLTMHAPVKVKTDGAGQVCAFVAQPQLISGYDKGGRPGVVKADKPEVEIPCEIVLVAIGQDIVSEPFAQYGVNPKRKTLETAPGSTLLKTGGQVFAGGDCVLGPATVIKAIAAGKEAAVDIDASLGYHHKFQENVAVPAPSANNRALIGRVNLTELSARERKADFRPLENNMSLEEAMQECGRCLRCDHFGCGEVEGGRV